MKFFKGLLKYALYFFIAAWLFLLGIMVGRGTSPLIFNTDKFQKRLETIADDFDSREKVPEKIDLKFYVALNKPNVEEIVVSNKNKSKENIREILPKQEIALPEGIPLKKARKKQTKKKPQIESKSKNKTKSLKAKYTIQIAAHKNFKDAVSHMTAVKEKGVSSYRVKVLKGKETWYRVRSGSFSSFDEAKKFKKKLEKLKINSLIIELD